MVIRKSKVITRLATVVTATAMVVPLMSVVGASTATATPKAPSTSSFPRSETLYTSGTAYSPPTNFNPHDTGQPLHRHQWPALRVAVPLRPDPQQVHPVAGHAAPGAATTYTIHVRNGVNWSDGSALTGADVAYTINLAKTNPAVPYSNLGQYLRGQARQPAATP